MIAVATVFVMHLTTALILIASTPLVAFADDDPPPPMDETAAPAPPPAPVEAPPAPPSTVTPVSSQPIPESTWCDYHHAAWNRPLHPRFAIGIAHGHLGGDLDGTQSSLLARIVLRHGFEVEGEFAKATLGGDTEKTGEAALVKTFGHHHLQPYVLAGAGGGKLDRADGTDPHLRFAEIGGGLMLRLHHVAIGADIRKGVREVDSPAMDTAARMTTPGETDHDHFTRGRILALVYF
jgi:hypothetical protein